MTSHQPTEKTSSWGRSAFYYACSLVSWESCRLQSDADSDALRFCTFTGLFLFFFKFTGQLEPCSGLVCPVPGPTQNWNFTVPHHTQRVFAGAQCDFIIMIIKVSVQSYGPIYSSMMSRKTHGVDV